MMLKHYYFFLFCFSLLIRACKNAPKGEITKSLNNLPAYQLVEDWPRLPPGYILGNPTGIGIDSNQNIFIY